MKIMEGTMQHTDTCIYISAHWRDYSLHIPGEFQLQVLCLAVGFAATFVTVTLRKEMKFSFGVSCPPDGCPCGMGGLEEDTAAPAGLSL